MAFPAIRTMSLFLLLTTTFLASYCNADEFRLRTEMDLDFGLSFGFPDSTEVGLPTEKELWGLTLSTEVFYFDWLSDPVNTDIGNYVLTSFSITNSSSSITEDPEDLPLMMYLSAHLTFDLMDLNDNELDNEKVLGAMESVDYKGYLSNTVGVAPPTGGLFSEATEVAFSAVV